MKHHVNEAPLPDVNQAVVIENHQVWSLCVLQGLQFETIVLLESVEEVEKVLGYLEDERRDFR